MGFFALWAGLPFLGWILALAAPVLADCGDSIGGRRVPCSCGDIVVGDTRLQPGDPVITEPCPADGLLVLAPVDAPSIILDLNGQERHGSGAGIGIRVICGGAQGAEIIGGIGGVFGTVTGFGEGIRSTRPGDLRLIANVVVRESRVHRVGERDVTSRSNRLVDITRGRGPESAFDRPCAWR
jgi:hypothetical protein